MNQVDLICVWPDTIDFPLFRKFLRENRDRFKDVIIVWTKTNWSFPNIILPIRDALAGKAITMVDSDLVKPGEDWRSVAVNTALRYSTAPWIFFTEQDFSPLGGFFTWMDTNIMLDDVNAFGAFDEDRLHPCCTFVKRDILDKTSLDFGANPEAGYDHFGKIQKDLEGYGTIGHMPKNSYKHMAGLTHNLMLYKRGEKPVYKPKEFGEYLKEVEQYEKE